MAYSELVQALFGSSMILNNRNTRYTQELIPVKDIFYGMVMTTDDRYLKVVEINPSNYHIKSESDKENIIATFAAWLKLAPAKLQFKIKTEVLRENAFVKRLVNELKASEDEILNPLYASNIEHITRLTQRNALRRRYFLIFEFEPEKKDAGKTLSKRYIAEQLNATVTQMEAYFAEMGNPVVHHKDENLFLGELFYEQLFPTRSKTVSFIEHAQRIIQDKERIDEQYGIKEDLDKWNYSNMIAPIAIKSKANPDTIINDKTYIQYYYISSSGYPAQVESGFLSSSFTGIAGVDIDIHTTREDALTFIKILKQKMKFTRHKAVQSSEEQTDYTNILDAYQSQQYLDQILSDQNNKQDPHYFGTYLTVRAESYEELQTKCREIEKIALLSTIDLVPLTRMQLDGFEATLPLNRVPDRLWYKSRRNVVTYDLASIYPFTEYELNDAEGVFLGMNLSTQSLLCLDLYNTDKYNNANMIIMGGSGAGKTFTLSLLAERMVLLNQQVFLLTSKKGHEYKRLTDALNGTFVKFAGDSTVLPNINIFDIRPESDVKKELYGMAGSLLQEKIAGISGWLQLLFKDLSKDETLILERAIKETYAAIGITNDNDTIYVNNDPESGVLKQMPILEDMLTALTRIDEEDAQTEVPKRLYSLIKNFIMGPYSAFNSQTNVDLGPDKKIIIFDLGELSEDMEPAIMHLVLDYVWTRVKEDPTIKKTVMLEEAWNYIAQGASETTAKIVREIYKIIRGYGGNAISATQEMGDFTSSEYGRTLIECSSLKVIMGMEKGVANIVQNFFSLSNNERKDIESFKEGRAILLAGEDHIPMKFEASPLEKELITTNIHDLRRIYQTMKNKA